MTYRFSSTAHLLTIDVRDYFHDLGFARVAPPDQWPAIGSRLDGPIDRLLAMLASAGASATFFVPASVARENPALVRRIASAGHEIGSHGDTRLLAGELTRSILREEARASKAEIEDVTGTRVVGFRAPFCTLTACRAWALETLIEEGFEYDSSCLPSATGDLGEPGVPAFTHVVQCASGTLTEVPATAVCFLGRTARPGIVSPLRAAPYAAVRRTFAELAAGKLPGVLALAAWELDAEQPRLAAPIAARVRHYAGLRATAAKLERALADFRFEAVAHGLAELSRNAPVTHVA